jgi:hypothetical protein
MNKAQVEKIHNALRTADKKANVAGYIVLDSARDHIGTVRVSYPRDGSGQLKVLAADWTAKRPRDADGNPDFTNWTPWQYGWANGGGYDKATAALSGMCIGTVRIEDSGYDWAHQLRDAGYIVLQAV